MVGKRRKNEEVDKPKRGKKQDPEKEIQEVVEKNAGEKEV